jgi:hypothetical protein
MVSLLSIFPIDQISTYLSIFDTELKRGVLFFRFRCAVPFVVSGGGSIIGGSSSEISHSAKRGQSFRKSFLITFTNFDGVQSQNVGFYDTALSSQLGFDLWIPAYFGLSFMDRRRQRDHLFVYKKFGKALFFNIK